MDEIEDRLKEIEDLYQRLDKEKAKVLNSEDIEDVTITVSALDLCNITEALAKSRLWEAANSFVKGSVGKNITSEKRWEISAEIMFLKEQGRKLDKYDDTCFIEYSVLVKQVSKKSAVEKLSKKYGFPSTAACCKWLCRKLDDVNAEFAESSIENPFLSTPKPNTWSDD